MTEPALLGLTFAEAAELDDSDRVALLGGKGAALVRMTELGLPVPPGFILTTVACRMVLEHGWSSALNDELAAGVSWMEQQLDRRLGDPGAPLLVSVRSGAPVSMPGMMDTVLNVGVTEAVAEALSERSSNGLFGWDTARRFVQSYGTVVAEAPAELVGSLSGRCLGPNDGRSLSSVALAAATRRLREALAAVGHSIPDDPGVQLQQAAQAVFASWNSERAKVYRRVEGIADDFGTAVTVQAMTFGNLGEGSGTGVAFSRDPSTGAPALVGEFLPGAQGEDVVVGLARDPAAVRDGDRLARDGRRTRRGRHPARAGPRRHRRHRVHGRGGRVVAAAGAPRQAQPPRRPASRHRHGRGSRLPPSIGPARWPGSRRCSPIRPPRPRRSRLRPRGRDPGRGHRCVAGSGGGRGVHRHRRDPGPGRARRAGHPDKAGDLTLGHRRDGRGHADW